MDRFLVVPFSFRVVTALAVNRFGWYMRIKINRLALKFVLIYLVVACAAILSCTAWLDRGLITAHQIVLAELLKDLVLAVSSAGFMAWSWKFMARGSEGKGLPTAEPLSPLADSVRKDQEGPGRENEAKFRAIFNNSALGTAIVEPNGTISMVNDAYCRASGYTREQVVGKSWQQTVVPEERERLTEYSRRRLANAKDAPAEYEFRYRHANGHTRYAEMAVALIPESNQTIAAMLDITERKRQSERLSRLNECFIGLGVSPEENIQHLVDFCSEMSQAACALYNRLQDGRLRTIAWKAPADFSLKDMEESHLCAEVIQQNTGRPVVIRDLPATAYARTEPNINRFGLKTYIGVVVRCRELAVGSLCLAYQTDVVPDEEMLKLLCIMAKGVGIQEECKQVQKRLLESEHRYRDLFENITEGFAFCQMVFEEGRPIDFAFLAVNQMFTTQTGLEGVAGKRATEVIPGIRENDPELFAIFGRVAATGKAERFERYFKALNLWLDASVYSNQPGCFVVIFDVITQRKLAEERLQMTATQLLEAQRIASLGSYDFNIGTGIWTGSEVLDQVFGITAPDYRRDLAGWLQIVHPEDRAELQRYLQEDVLRGRATFDRSYRILRRDDQQERWVHGLGKLVLDERGQLVRMVGVIQDITEHKQAEQRLSLQSSALSAAANAIVITDRHGRIEWVNPAFTKLTGYSAEEAVGSFPRVLKSGQHPPAFYASMWATILTGNVWHGALINKRKDGTLYHEEMTITPVPDAHGQIAHFIGIKLDVTERRQLDSRLQQAQKMEAIGALAGGIAHDFNNILSAIFGYLYLLQQEITANTEAQEAIAEILNASNRAKDLVQQILTFSRQREHKRELIQLETVIKEATKFMRASLPSSIKIDLHLPDDQPPVMADPTQIYQVIMNLATNALHAMEGRPGQLTISLETIQADEQFIKLHPGLKPIPYARLTVTDTGRGMDAKTLERIFEPFFTTKPLGQGTGLGLSVVHGIVCAHEGAITVYSEPGRGTTFNLYFPSEKRTQPLPVPAGSTELKGRGQKILLLDDEPALTNVLKRQLTRLNYQADSRNSAREAIELIRENPARFDLVISDLTMPEMNGLQVARALQELRADLPIVLVSGFTADLKIEDLRAAGICELVDKPISITVLAKVLTDILDGEVTPGRGEGSSDVPNSTN
jgi:PAS domain S-box-containing protein